MHSPKLNNLMLSGLSNQTITLAYGMLLIIKSNVSTATSRYNILGWNVGVWQEEIEKDTDPRGMQIYRDTTKIASLLLEFQNTSACNA